MSKIDFNRFCPKCQCKTERNASGKCKDCAKAKTAAWRVINPERSKTANAAWAKANPDKTRAIGVAWRASNSEKVKVDNAVWRAANSGKIKIDNARWRAANQERHKANAIAWAKENPEARRIHHQNRRAKISYNGGVLSKGLSAKLFKLQRGKCACCSLPLGDNFHLDHIMPIALGGPNVDDNIQLLRQRCNTQKRAKHPVDFMQERGLLL